MMPESNFSINYTFHGANKRNSLIIVTVLYAIFNPVHERTYASENWECFSGRTSRNSPAYCASQNKSPTLWTHKRPATVTVATADVAAPAKTSAKHWLVVNGLKKWISFGASWVANRRNLGLLQLLGFIVWSCSVWNSPTLKQKSELWIKSQKAIRFNTWLVKQKELYLKIQRNRTLESWIKINEDFFTSTISNTCVQSRLRPPSPLLPPQLRTARRVFHISRPSVLKCPECWVTVKYTA